MSAEAWQWTARAMWWLEAAPTGAPWVWSSDRKGFSIATLSGVTLNQSCVSLFPGFPVPAGQPWQPNAGQKDIVLIYLDPAGGFKWSFQLGSTQNDTVSACETDAWGNVYAAGRSDVCLRSPSSSTCTHREYGDLFVIKLDSGSEGFGALILREVLDHTCGPSWTRTGILPAPTHGSRPAIATRTPKRCVSWTAASATVGRSHGKRSRGTWSWWGALGCACPAW